MARNKHSACIIYKHFIWCLRFFTKDVKNRKKVMPFSLFFITTKNNSAFHLFTHLIMIFHLYAKTYMSPWSWSQEETEWRIRNVTFLHFPVGMPNSICTHRANILAMQGGRRQQNKNMLHLSAETWQTDSQCHHQFHSWKNYHFPQYLSLLPTKTQMSENIGKISETFFYGFLFRH